MIVKVKSNILIKNMALIIALTNIALWDYLDNVVPFAPFIIMIVEAVVIWVVRRDIELVGIKNVLIVSFIILLHQIICILQNQTTMEAFVKQFVLIFICYICYMITFSGFKVRTIFKGYYIFAIFIACVVFFQEIVVVLGIPVIDKLPVVFEFSMYYYKVAAGLIRANAFFREPSFLVYVLTPAVYVSLLILANKFSERDRTYNKIVALMIVLSYLLSFSSIGLIGLMLMIVWIVLKSNWNWKTVLAVIGAVGFFIIAYVGIPDVKMRVDDTIEAITVQDLNELGSNDVNLSSITLVSHAHLAAKIFAETSGWGAGLGSYAENYDRYMQDISEYSYMLGYNREDANSMLLRMLAEVGIIGIVLLIMFLVHYYPSKVSKENMFYQHVSDGLLILFALRLFRQGNYVHGGFFFFVCLYMLVYAENKYLGRKQNL